jgi:hypothetical protein
MLSRRQVLQSAGATAVLAALPAGIAAAAPNTGTAPNADITGQLARYMIAARENALAFREQRTPQPIPQSRRLSDPRQPQVA